MFSAAFKVIKNWLPTKAVQKIKFVTRQNLGEYVTPDQALLCWGGNDHYTFKFVPEYAELDNGKLEDNKKKVCLLLLLTSLLPLLEYFTTNFSKTIWQQQKNKRAENNLIKQNLYYRH